MFIFFWFGLSFLVAWLGSTRAIGFWFSLILSFILSPLVGLIIVVLSDIKSNSNDNDKPLDYFDIEQSEKKEK
jgi:hypothetical protein